MIMRRTEYPPIAVIIVFLKKIPCPTIYYVELALTTVADHATAPAASLYQFYEKKEIVKTFIIVTDEKENEQFEGYW